MAGPAPRAPGGFLREAPVRGDWVMSNGDLPKPITVIAYSGYKANEKPLCLVLDGRRLAIEEIVDRWYGVESDYFKVLAEDGRTYLIKWQRLLDVWVLLRVTSKNGLH